MPLIHWWGSRAAAPSCTKPRLTTSCPPLSPTAHTHPPPNTTWAALSLLGVFHVAHVGLNATGPNVAAASVAVEEVSTSDLAESVCVLIRAVPDDAQPNGRAAPPSPAVERSAATPAQVALLQKLYALLAAHEEARQWLRTREPLAATPDSSGAAEGAFLDALATFAQPCVPSQETSAPAVVWQPLQTAFTQLISANLYATSAFLERVNAAAPDELRGARSTASPRAARLEAAVVSALLYLVSLVFDVAEECVRVCASLHLPDSAPLSGHAGNLHRATLRGSASHATPSLANSLQTLLQEEGSHLLVCMLQRACTSMPLVGAHSIARDAVHFRVATRHVVRRLAPLLFRALPTACVLDNVRADGVAATSTLSLPTSAPAMDRTDAGLVTWMREELQRRCCATAAHSEESGHTKEGRAAAAAAATAPSSFATECLCALVHVLLARLGDESDAGVAVASSRGLDGVDRKAVACPSRLAEYVEVLCPALDMAPMVMRGELTDQCQSRLQAALVELRGRAVRHGLCSPP